MPERSIEEILRVVWTAEEEEHDDLDFIRKSCEPTTFDSLLEKMKQRRLLSQKDETVRLTSQGRKVAQELIRRHRLAERLFFDVFEANQSEYEKLACDFEHTISREVTESVCTFLGHPQVCPHNKPIPRGKCCQSYLNRVEPLIQPLVNIPVGQRARIVYMSHSHKKRWSQLHQFGMYPGNTIRLLQKKPSFVLEIGETTLALDDDICREIYVKKTS